MTISNNLTRLSPPDDVIQFLDTLTMPPGTRAEIVGVWVWIMFISKPDQVLRDALKEAGFTWVQKRLKWAHCGGKPSRKGSGNPWDKYPTADIRVNKE
jgi:hypothetical protein